MPFAAGDGMKGISEEFVQKFRERRIGRDWDLWQYGEWVKTEEATLAADNPGLYYYVNGVLAGVSETLDGPLESVVCQRLYFHFLELLAIVREHEEVESLEKLWQADCR